MSNETCPSCHSRDSVLLDRVQAGTLRDGYAAPGLGVDVAALLTDPQAEVGLNECRACGLRFYRGGAPGDAAFYEALQVHPWYYQSDKAEYAFAAQQVAGMAADARVLEVGCGRGALRAHLGPRVRYRGLEFNAAAVAAARAAGLDVVQRDLAAEAAQSPAAYDVVCHFQVLEHVSDPAGFMRDSAALLRPGGLLLVAVPAEDSFVGLAESSWLNMPPHHLTRWSDRALRAAFERVGVRPTALWHEPVAALHQGWQQQVLAQAGWLDLWGLAPRLVARPLLSRLGRAALRLPGLRARLQARALGRHPQAAQGHTLCMAGLR